MAFPLVCGATLGRKPLSIVWGVLQGGVVAAREFTHIWAMAHQAAHRRPLMPSAALLGEGRPPAMCRWGPGAWAAAPATLHPPREAFDLQLSPLTLDTPGALGQSAFSSCKAGWTNAAEVVRSMVLQCSC